MKKIVIYILFLLLNSQIVFAQNPKIVVVYLKDKQTDNFDPYHYFDAKNIARKKLAKLPLFDYRDLPINPIYVSKIHAICKDVIVESRWLNALFLKADEAQVIQLQELPFIRQVDEYKASTQKMVCSSAENGLSEYNKQILLYQTNRFAGKAFADKGLTGKGIRIAVFDVGFSGADKHNALAHLRQNGQIKGTYDFIKKDSNVYLGGAHGTNTLSCITGITEGVKMGMATDAEFLLARTEWSLKEDKQEEYFWLAAAEWADKNGADIISSSLGYGGDWYKVSDMNGKKSVVAFAATIAAQKGILVVNSAGNEYTDEWKTIVTPSDADSVLCVGGTDPFSDRHISFSSVGPSADYRIKPNVSAPGHVVAANPNGTLGATFGTSFSCPLTSGFAACAWQNNRNLSNMELFKQIQEAGHLYPYYDYMHGYGIPQATFFTSEDKRVLTPNISIKVNANNTKEFMVAVMDSAIIEKLVLLEVKNKQANKAKKGFNFYWNISNEKGQVVYYEVIQINSLNPIILKPKLVVNNYTLNFHFEGYTGTINLTNQ